MVLVGTYEPESYTMTMTATNDGGGPAGKMAMKMKVDAKRIGDCDGKEKSRSATDGKRGRKKWGCMKLCRSRRLGVAAGGLRRREEGAPAGEAPAKLAAGLYELSAEVIQLASTDKTTPATKLKQGDNAGDQGLRHGRRQAGAGAARAKKATSARSRTAISATAG